MYRSRTTSSSLRGRVTDASSTGRGALVGGALAVLAFLVTSLIGVGHTTFAQQEDETPAVGGVISINGDPGWAGIGLQIENSNTTGDPVVCGDTTTSEGGSYRIEINEECAEGDTVVAVLTQLSERRASADFVLAAPEGAQTSNFAFALQAEDLEELPPPPEVAPVVIPVDPVREAQATSVFDEVRTLLIILLVAGTFVLVAMALALLQVSNRRYDFLTKSIQEMDSTDTSQREFLSHAMQLESEVQQSRYKVFRWMVEGLVMSFVVIAVIALGAAGKVEAQGIVSVLAAMVGYAAGRSTS